MNILEIEIQTDNLNETEKFYSELLGLQTKNKNQNSISFLAGHSTLTFIKSNRLKPKYHFAFNIPHNKLDEAIIWTSAKLDLIKNVDNEIVSNFESWNAKAIYFFDNNGNILEFIARFDLDNASDEAFDISSIQSISEIGIVTDTPIKLADKLVEENNLCFFAKGAKSEKFVTLGSDNGLLIIVETNRKWYPTEQEAEKHFTKIKISTDGLTRVITMNEENVSR
ncbi:MAG: VOC family protein [Ignavibacteriales bacterium]|nr:VOC family protein [Ignavibacteriales bacterium]